MARRLYLGKLPPDTRNEDVSKVFDQYGHIVDCRVMTGFGFIEYESSKEAEEAVNDFVNKPFMGANIVVEFAKESRPRREREPYPDDRRGPRARRPPGIRILVQNVNRDVSWQDLKDFGREAGSVSFADIDRDVPGQGILEYLAREDAERAVKDLDGRELRGKVVTVALDSSRTGADNYRRDDRRDEYRSSRDDRYRDDRYSSRDDRYGRDDRPREDRDRSYRRDRSRSPRRDYDDRRRSPPPKREYDDRKSTGYDDYRRSSYDDRKIPDYPERRRDDSSRRRDDKDDRYDDRPPRSANGDGGWSR